MPFFLSGLFKAIAFFIAAILFFNILSSIPVPLPVTFSTATPQISEVIAEEGVVFAIPISPVPSISIPFFNSSSTSSIPASIDFIASFSVIAGPFVKFFLPCPTFLILNSEFSIFSSAATPISATITFAPVCLAKTFIPAPPRKKL